MPIVINPASEYAKELRKWEQHHTAVALDENGESKPGNPYAFRPYPAMLYKARKRPNGQYSVVEGVPNAYHYPDAASYERACLEADSFNKSCQLIVHSPEQEQREKDRGWRNSPQEALAYAEALEQDMARAAAETAFHASRMGEKARTELREAEQVTHEHVVDVQPRRRGAPKAVTGTGPIED